MMVRTLAVALLSLVACSSAPRSDVASAPPPTAPSTQGADADAGTPVDALPDAPPEAPPSPDAAAPTDAVVAEPAPPLVGLRALTFRAGARPPRGAAGTHGATVWAVTLAASAGPSPDLTALFQQAQAAHLAAGVGDLSCSPAVGGDYPSAVPSGDGAQALTVTFRSERDARQFAAALTEAPLRVGRVRFMCAD
jgi:nucleoid-associated protein YgaU